MTNTTAFRIASTAGLLAVGLGAFGAHGLQDLLETNNRMATWETAVLYHFIHAVMLVLLSLRSPLARGPWLLFLAGIVIFSGSLYVLSLTNTGWLGAITPVGGVCFILGWLWLIVSPGPGANRDSTSPPTGC
jgi:uncharacterized membrane protein YgdD (TMEM256/DUF423 family)